MIRRVWRGFLFRRPAVVSLCLLVGVSLAFGQAANINGTVVDSSGASVSGAQVLLSVDGRGPDRNAQSGAGGAFSFPDVSPGAWRMSFTAKGFASRKIEGEVKAGETLELPPTVLAIDTVDTEMNVTQTQAEVAQAQIKEEEQQRLLALVPNFFVTYDPNVAPLNAKQKLELTARSWLDPSAFVINGMIAGVGQAQNSHKGFGQGAQGYGKRYGAGFAEYGTSLLLGKFVAPTVFKQDPRYFYKGTGTNRARFLYAISRTFVCRGDNKKDQFCYSSFVDRFGTGFVTNYYYPAADRDKASVVLRNSALSVGFDALGNLFQEFIARKITRKH